MAGRAVGGAAAVIAVIAVVLAVLLGHAARGWPPRWTRLRGSRPAG